MNAETRRQIVHICLGLLAIFLLYSLGRFKLMVLGFGALIIGSLFINRRLCKGRDILSDTVVRLFERKDAPLPFWGFAWYAIGILIILVFLSAGPEIAAGIFLLAAGDGISTIVGKHGRIKNPFNKQKTVEGSIAFFLVGLLSYFWIGWYAVPLSLLCAIVESLPLRFDDNATIPIAVVIFFMVI